MGVGDQPIDEECRRRFEAHRADGGDDPLEAFLPDPSSVPYAPTVEELVCIDLEFRWDAWEKQDTPSGEPPAVDDYLGRFPLIGQPAVRARLERELAWLAKPRRAGPLTGVGTQVGRYELTKPAGRGAFADVWKAWDPELHRDVAIKIPKPELAEDEHALGRVVQEARSAAQLRHPSIVTVHEVLEHHGRPCIVSDFISGPTLAEAMRGRPFTADAAAGLVEHLAEALAYAHECGVVHRDVKPANVLISDDGRPVLTDFGLAHLQASETTLTRAGEILGTPVYMSPEQARGATAEVDPRSDVYSLGAVLYELLSGRIPFEEPSTAGVLYAVVHREPAAPSAHGVRVPPDLETICLKAMAKEPDRRYPTARELAADLRRYLDRMPVLARRPGPWERFRLWVRRNPALAATVAASVTALFLVSAFSVASILEERDRFREQRDQAQENLYRSLVREAESQIIAHDTGWNPAALGAIGRAAALDVPGRDVRALRDLALRCQGSREPSFNLLDTWQPHEGRARWIDWSVDRRVVGVSRSGAVWLRDAETGRVLAARPAAAEPRPLRAVFHPSGERIAVGADDGTVTFLDGATLEPRGAVLEGEGPVGGLAYSRDGAWLAVGRGDGRIEQVRCDETGGAPTPGRVAAAHTGAIVALSLSPDGRRIATSGEDGMVRVWTWPDLVQEDEHHSRDLAASLAFTATGDGLAFATRESFGFRILTVGSGEAPAGPREAIHLRGVERVFFDRVGRPVTASADGTLRVWTPGREPITVARGEFDGIVAAAEHPAGTQFLAAHADGRLRLWELVDPRGRHYWSSFHAAVFVPGTERLATTNRVAFDYGAPEGPTTWRFEVNELSALVPEAATNTVLSVLEDGRVVRTHHGPSQAAHDAWQLPVEDDGDVTAAAVDLAGERMAVGTEDGTLRVVRVDEPGAAGDRHRLPAGPVSHVAFGPAGEVAALCADSIHVLTPAGRLEHLASGEFSGEAVAFGGGMLATPGSDGLIHIRRPPDFSKVRALDGHDAGVTAIAFDAAAGRMASGDREGGLRLWHTATWESVSVDLPRAVSVRFLAFDPLGELLVAGGSEGLVEALVDVGSARLVARLGPGHGTDGAFAPDGSAYLVGNGFGGVFSFPRGALIAARDASLEAAARGEAPVSEYVLPEESLIGGGPFGALWGIAASPDGRTIATSAHTGQISLWDAETLVLSTELLSLGEISWAVAFSPDSRTVAACTGGEIALFDVASRSETVRLPGHDTLATGVAFHPSRPLLASISLDGELRLWSTSGADLGLLHDGESALHDVAFAPDGSRLVAACDDGSVLVWDAADLEPALERAVALESPVPASRRLTEHRGPVWAVAFDARGRYLASGSQSGRVLLRDAADLEVLAALQGTVTRLRSLSFDSDSRRLAAASWLTGGVTWDLDTLRTVLRTIGLNW